MQRAAMPPTIADARTILSSVFGYPDFRPAQVGVIHSVMARHHTLAVLPTGGGKSLCYQVPALALGGLTIVVSPLISLMQDQVDRLVALGVRAAFLNSTLEAAASTRSLTRAAAGDLTMLYVAPERFQSPSFMTAMRGARVTLIAVDEAHCISEWGHEFRPSFRKIGEARRELGAPQLVALTATATPVVRKDILRQLGVPEADVHVAGFDRTNLSYVVQSCRDDSAKTRALLEVLRGDQLPAIVYAATRGSVEIVARRLSRAGIRAAAYHAGLADAKRRDAQDAFMQGDIPVIVATNAFGMGIDKSNVRLVAHHSMPGTLEAYYQEAGRAGRDGRQSRCVLLYHPDDRRTYEHFIAQAHPPRALVDRVYAAIVSTSRDDRVAAEPAVRAACGRMSADQYAAAIAMLTRHEVLRPAEDNVTIRVRLLATPIRIRRELTANSSDAELRLLRTLWRRRPADGYDAFDVPLAALDGGSPRATRALLERLCARQFVDVQPIDSALRVARPATPLAAMVDWDAVARRRAHELSKLDAMESYARTNMCRRAFVLRYFGDVPASRASPRCTGCDNCLGRSMLLPWTRWRH